MKNEKAVVVFSGGQDSTTCLLWALQQFEEVETVTFHYNQRHQEEIDVAKRIADKLGVKNHLLDMSLLNQLAPNALTRDDIDIEEKEGELPSTFVIRTKLSVLILRFYSCVSNRSKTYYHRCM